MDRRTFLSSFFGVAANNRSSNYVRSERILSTGLEPWVPSATDPWDEVHAGHLLRRTTFLPRWTDIDAILKMAPGDAVDLLLTTPSTPTPPAMADHWTDSLEGLDIVLINQRYGEWRADATALRAWLTEIWHTTGVTIAEKLTFFWHGHFTSEFEVDENFVIAPLLYRQNQLFRENGLLNFRDLVFYVTLDGGMLVYLGGDGNKKGTPNENYAREVMELFTMGIGHYSEGDIKEAARILTGWHAQQFHDKEAPNGMFNSYFIPADHDTGSKQFLNVTFPARDSSTNTEFIVKKEEIRKFTDTLFDQQGDAIATFMCRKLYRFFVYSNPSKTDEDVITAMAQIFKDNNFDIKPVLSALLKSAHFFDNQNIGAQIKTPAELASGMSRQFSYASTKVPGDMASIDEIIFDPPNVSGWPGWHDWITTNNFPTRSSIASGAVNGMDQTTLLNFIKQFPDYDQAGKLADHLAALVLPRPLSTERKDSWVKILTNNGPGEYVWTQTINSDPASAATYMKNLLLTIIELPDFQLC
jgi:uncharacterized protein (DUF1800 family)